MITDLREKATRVQSQTGDSSHKLRVASTERLPRSEAEKGKERSTQSLTGSVSLLIS